MIEPQASESKAPILTNEYGIVIPPPILDCLGTECRFRGDQEECEPNDHHLHSTEILYALYGRKEYKFRDMRSLRVWMYQCQHERHHEEHDLCVPAPEEEIIPIARKENRWLKNINGKNRELQNTEAEMSYEDITFKAINGLRSKKEEIEEEIEELFDFLKKTVVLPEELVLGGLLLVKPEYVQKRILKGAGVALTGVIDKVSVPSARARALSYIAEARELELASIPSLKLVKAAA